MTCRDCGVELIPTGDNFNQFLEDACCIDCALRYRYCPHCGEFMLRVNMRNDVCRPCFAENPVLANYGARVETGELLDSVRYFGTELETEVTSNSASALKAQLRHIDKLLGENVIMKHDGSLSNGIEIVTKPFTLEKQFEIWTPFLDAKHDGLISWDSSRCGLHIHVSRAGLTEATIAKAVCFVNSHGNKKFMYVIAGRKQSNYAQFKAKTFEEAGKYSGERREAINLANSHTVEFRLFKGTLKKESVFKNLEFCDALLDYCAQDGLTVSQAMSRASFIRFVRKEGRWPHLMSFIMSRWFGKATELSDQAGWKPKKNCSIKTEMELALEE